MNENIEKQIYIYIVNILSNKVMIKEDERKMKEEELERRNKQRRRNEGSEREKSSR